MSTLGILSPWANIKPPVWGRLIIKPVPLPFLTGVLGVEAREGYDL